MFNNIDIKPFYNTYIDDISKDFYERVLSKAVKYNRVSAFFSSKALALYSNGIVELYKNKGKIKFIVSKEISEYDYNQMVEGYKNRKKLENELLESLDEELSIEEKIKLSNITTLIERKVLDIKIAFVKHGIFHDKFGLIYDENGKCIYFRGSNNETVAAIEENYESFEVSCNWNQDKFENIKIKNAEKMFLRLWNNEQEGIQVLEIPETVKRKLMSFNRGILKNNENVLIKEELYLDINEDEKLIIINGLNKGKIDRLDRYFQVYLNRFLTIQDDNIIVKNINNYLDMKKLISRLKEYGNKKKFNIEISNELKKFIENKDMEIEKREKLGIDIKNRESYLNESFEDFVKILNTEMVRKLREPQLWDAFHIVKMWKAANFSVPGAGKTSIVYGAYAYLSSPKVNKIDKIVMIGPKSSFYAWKDEFKNNFGEKRVLNVLDIQDDIYTNPEKKIIDLRNNSGNKNLILINYEALIGLRGVLKEILNDRVLLVFDEVHKIKGIDSKRAEVALDIAKKVKYKVVLTGTPIPNGYQDIYNTLKILYPDEYDSIFGFNVKSLKTIDNTKAKEINQKIYPFYCRTNKKDLQIPSANEDKIIISNMTNEERMLFRYIHSKYRRNIFALYIRLMQAASNPKLLLNKLDLEELNSFFLDEDDNPSEENDKSEEYKNIEIDEISDKEIVRLIDKINKTTKYKSGIKLTKKLVQENKQVLIWGIFVDTLEKIENELKNDGIKCAVIDGRISYKDREKIINDFNNKKIKVLIANPNTLAESVSLHHCCHDAIYFEYNFNLTHMLQSKDRINRLGLKENQYTQYYYLMLKNNIDNRYDSIDERTYYRLKEKEKLMIKAIEGTELRRFNFNDEEEMRIILNKQ